MERKWPSSVCRVWRALVGIAYLWAVGNCVYVYLFLGGNRTYRVEAAALIFIGIVLPSFVLVAPAPRRGSWSRAQAMLLIGIAAALWLVALAPQSTSPLLNDDYVFLDRYRTAADAFNSPYFFRPLFASVFWLVRTIGHDSAGPFHVLSLCVHAASAGCVYFLARRILDSSTGAAIAAALFLINPLQLEVSLWASGLQDGLWTLCILAAALVYTGRPAASARRIALTALLAACGLLAKETAVCFVLVLPLFDVVVGSNRGARRRLATYGLFAAELGAYLWLRSHFAVSVDHQLAAAPTRYFVKQFLTTPYRVFVFPWNAAAVDVPLMVQCAIAVAVLTSCVLAFRRPALRLLVGPALIAASTLPLAGYFFVGPDLTAARYVYFGAVGWSLIVAETLNRCIRNPTIRLGTAATLVAALFLALWVNLRPWRAAADLVRGLDDAVKAGRSPADVVRQWQATHHSAVALNSEGMPDSYQGVYIFANGYPEYLRLRSGR
jgi:hypothetical protein